MSESLATFANQLGIVPRGKPGKGFSSSSLTEAQVLDLAVAAYWDNRPDEDAAA